MFQSPSTKTSDSRFSPVCFCGLVSRVSVLLSLSSSLLTLISICTKSSRFVSKLCFGVPGARSFDGFDLSSCFEYSSSRSICTSGSVYFSSSKVLIDSSALVTVVPSMRVMIFSEGKTILLGHRNSSVMQRCSAEVISDLSHGNLVISPPAIRTSNPREGAVGRETSIAPKPGGSGVRGVRMTRIVPWNLTFCTVRGRETARRPMTEARRLLMVIIIFACISDSHVTSTSKAMQLLSSSKVRTSVTCGEDLPTSKRLRMIRCMLRSSMFCSVSRKLVWRVLER
mmetsp:Transcript_69792/g.103824  ORF Transcript_69792/g.103824 Transcript_69792/m.103824 type:complete len:283 (-) Transcript_69792:796-1644(-)